MPALPIVLSVENERAVDSAMRGVENTVKRTGAALDKGIGGKAASRLSAGFSAASAKVKELGIAGIAAGAAGSAALRSYSDSLISAGMEADASAQKLNALLEMSGQTGAADKLSKMADAMSAATGMDDDAIVEASARMINLGVSAEQTSEIFPKLAAKARLSGKDMNTAARVMGTAFQTGSTKGLDKIGIDLGAAGDAAVKAAFKISEAKGQAELFKRVMVALERVDVGAGINSAAAAMGRNKVLIDNMQEGMGKGAAAQRARMAGLVNPILERVAGNESAQGAIGAAIELGAQLSPVATGLIGLGQAMPALEKLPSLGGAAKRSFDAVSGGLKASGFAATLAGDAHLLAARNINIASKNISAGSLMNPQSTAGKLGVGLAAVAGIGYGVSETIAGTANSTTMSDKELDSQGLMGKFHRAAAGFYEKWNYRGIARQYQSASLDQQIAEQNRKNAEKFGARRTRNGTETKVTIAHPPTPADRGLRAY